MNSPTTETSGDPGVAALRAVPDLVVRLDEPAALHTRLRVGGAVAIWLVAETEAAARGALKVCRTHRISVRHWPGASALIRDGGLSGACLRLGAVAEGLEIGEGGQVRVGAGYPAAALAIRAIGAGLGGLIELAGRAGTVADAWREGLLKGRIEEVRILRGSRVATVAAEKLKPSQTPIIFTLKLSASRPAKLRAEAEAKIRARRGSGIGQPGRVMTDPKGRGARRAGELIADAGLCGVRLRGARIGVREPNAILTQAKASTRDVLLLTRMITDRVYMNSGVELQSVERPIGRN